MITLPLVSTSGTLKQVAALGRWLSPIPSSLRGELGMATRPMAWAIFWVTRVTWEQGGHAPLGGDPLGDHLHLSSRILRRCRVPEHAGQLRGGTLPRVLLCLALFHVQKVVVSTLTR